MNFDIWMKEVDRELVTSCGLDSNDLPDVYYMGMFEDKVSPMEAAQDALENAGYFDCMTFAEGF
tara:strand:+ start:1053 stop:1244 length:192 start_codon:yes stop_codon:yes gene_type:complete